MNLRTYRTNFRTLSDGLTGITVDVLYSDRVVSRTYACAVAPAGIMPALNEIRRAMAAMDIYENRGA